MVNASIAQPRHIPWDLTACGADGQGPFRLVLHFSHGSITEYFLDVSTAFRAIENAEKRPAAKIGEMVPNRMLLAIPNDVDLVKHCFREEAWANGARH
jgi:hypothetical protein